MNEIETKDIKPKQGVIMDKEQRFEKMLEHCPLMATYYNIEEHTIDVGQLKSDFPCKSPGEKIMLAFLKVVWDGPGDWFEEINYFPVLEEFGRLDQRGQQLIAQWTASPFWM